MANNYLRYKYRLLTGASYRVLYVFVDDVELRSEIMAQSSILAGVNTAVLVTCIENYDVCMEAARALGFHLQIDHRIESQIEAAVKQALRTGFRVDMRERVTSSGKTAASVHAGSVETQSYALTIAAAAKVLRKAFYTAMGVDLSEEVNAAGGCVAPMHYAGMAFSRAVLYCFAGAAGLQTFDAFFPGRVDVNTSSADKPARRISAKGVSAGRLTAAARFPDPQEAHIRSRSFGELTAAVMTMLRGFFTGARFTEELTVAPRAGPVASVNADTTSKSEGKLSATLKLLSYLLCKVWSLSRGVTRAVIDKVGVLSVRCLSFPELYLNPRIDRDEAVRAESSQTLQGEMRTVATLTRPSVLADYDGMSLAELDGQILGSMSLIEI